jgi:hypothetical protein
MKRVFTLIFILFNFTGCAKEMNKKKDEIQNPIKNQFQAVWNEVASDEYAHLPQNSVSFGKLFTWSKNIILENAKRTLEERANILEPFEKLAHPNGVCLKGLWEIQKENDYSGYFKQGIQALIIARASSAMSNTKRGEIRAFGLAGKLFPTSDALKINSADTANFFVIDDLGGTKAEHFTDVALTNEPSVTTNSEVIKHLIYALKVAKAFADADEHSGIRQLYEISELEEKAKVNTPKWMKITAKAGQTVDADDFRDELKVKKNKKLIFEIAVANQELKGQKEWQSIGTITFDDSVSSYSCDHRLHFHHPKWKE